MVKNWTSSWKASTQPRKQRKYRANAPKHVLRGFLSAHLAPPLRKKYQRRSISVRVGDKVTVRRGQFKGTSGKVNRVELKKSILFIEGVEFTKKDGTKITRPVHASKILITELDLDDKRRVEALKRGGAPEKKPAEKKE